MSKAGAPAVSPVNSTVVRELKIAWKIIAFFWLQNAFQ
jgi:hypothetical protein